jgi:hypothetical protein
MSKLITTHLTVDGPVEQVWQTLTDLDGYADWNPFITAAAGAVDVGQRLTLRIQPPGGRAKTFTPWVTAVEKHRYLEWLGRLGMPGLFDGRHSFSLTPLPGRRTLLQQSETFSGVLVPFAGSIFTPTRAGFEAMNAALARKSLRLPS